MKHHIYMKKAIEQALKGRGYVSPNPLVGAVIVKNNKIISKGYHKKYGDIHAEIDAIENSKESLKDTILYCNLEPCCNDYPTKKNPPCVNRIIFENIKKVVIGIKDPNSQVNGKGIQKLRENNIEVIENILEKECYYLNEHFFKFIKTGIPFVHLKIAQSIDGRIAAFNGHSKWITNNNALKKVHEMRAYYDAVLVGRGTALQDDPSLTVRHINGRDPYRILVDTKLKIDINNKLVTDHNKEKTIIFCSSDHNKEKSDIFRKRNIKIFIVDKLKNNRLDLNQILTKLGELKIISLLVEGGSEIFTSFVKEELFDKITIFIAPIIIGNGINSINELNTNNIKNSFKLKNVSIKNIDDQIVFTAYKKDILRFE